MKLDRNIDGAHGRGKYALLLVRKLPEHLPVSTTSSRDLRSQRIWNAIGLLEDEGLIEWGEPGSDEEFFVIKLKDRHSNAGLNAYAQDARIHGDREYGSDVQELADRAGPDHPKCKFPD
jgi:hypothetical protein